MKLKKSCGLLLGLLLTASSCLAQEVTVVGTGMDKDSATRDAMRLAVEQVVGTFVDSKTLVSKSVVALDEIYAKSQGYVRNIRILDETALNGSCQVKALIDVDANPSSELMNKLNMLMLLNDPRVAVVVSYYGEEWKEKYPAICEASMNSKLLELGFNHVVDSGVIKDRFANVRMKNNDTDYIVLGKLEINTNNIALPSYKDMTKQTNGSASYNTGLLRSLAEMDVKVLKTDTQEVIGTFRVEADAAKNNANTTENEAVKTVGVKAAERLRQVFALKAANTTKLLQIIVRADSNDKVMKLEDAVKKVAGVQNAFVRSYNNGKGLIEVDGSLKPQQLYRALREKMPLFMERSSDNSLEVSM